MERRSRKSLPTRERHDPRAGSLPGMERLAPWWEGRSIQGGAVPSPLVLERDARPFERSPHMAGHMNELVVAPIAPPPAGGTAVTPDVVGQTLHARANLRKEQRAAAEAKIRETRHAVARAAVRCYTEVVTSAPVDDATILLCVLRVRSFHTQPHFRSKPSPDHLAAV